MYSRTILIRTLTCIEKYGYISKVDAMISERESTADMVRRTLSESPDITDHDEATHGSTADKILDWIIRSPTTDDYMKGCKWAIDTADYDPDKVFGYICSLVTGYRAHMDKNSGMEFITSPNTFAADLGATIENVRCMCINTKTRYKNKRRVCLVGPTGCLIVYHIPAKEIAIPTPMREYDIVSGKVIRHKFGTPFETLVTNVTIKELSNNET